MTVYFISGLGADKRAFHKIQLNKNHTIVHIAWPIHDKDETLESYCLKISKLIDTSQDFSIVGLSFGGIIAVELSKILFPKNLIIISSVSSKYELPSYFRAIGFLKIYKLIPAVLMNKVSMFSNLFNNVSDKNDKNLITQIIKETNPYFIKWSIDKIINWENKKRPKNLFHIHGNDDRVFFYKNVKADKLIKGGGHFMILTNAEEISAEINTRLGYS